MKTVLAAALISCVFFPVLLSAAGGDPTAGKAVYTQHCVSCHAADGKGNAKIATMMKVTIPDSSSKEAQAESDADLQKVISQGKGKMPAVKQLTDSDLHNLVAYIRTLAHK